MAKKGIGAYRAGVGIKRIAFGVVSRGKKDVSVICILTIYIENIIICSTNCAQRTNFEKCEVRRKRGQMKYWGNYYTKVAENERAVKIGRAHV